MKELLGEKVLFFIMFVKELNYPKEYFFHCDSNDKRKNLFNGRRSEILDCLEVKGEPYERVVYERLNNEFRDISAGDSINSVTLSVRNENGELFDLMNENLGLGLRSL